MRTASRLSSKAEAVYTGAEKELVGRIAAFVEGQGRKLAEMAPPMLKVELE